jgi:hypothetical protein
MKCLLHVLGGIFILTSIFLSCSKEQIKMEMIAKKTSSAVTIDGILSENIWADVAFVYLRDNQTREFISDPAYWTSVATCYDNQNLYLAFVCNDKDIFSYYTYRDEYLWQEECVEVFIDIDEDPNNYVEIEVSPNNILFDSFIVDTANIDLIETPKFNLKDIETGVQVDGTVNQRDDLDHRWTVEIAIPLVELFPLPDNSTLSNRQIKINFYRIDRDEDGPGFYAWSPTSGRFHKPSKFGILRFL